MAAVKADRLAGPDPRFNGSWRQFGRKLFHHIIPEEEKRPAKSAEEIFEELKAQDIPVEIHNGIYCKVVYGTFEAINPIPAVDDWDEYEEIYVKGE